jgi:L-fucose mutarotase
MLKGINPLLGPDLLHTLRAMGHRQDIAVVDANFPCEPQSRVIRLDGISAPAALDAILSVVPVEREEPAAAWRMIAHDDIDEILPVFTDLSDTLNHHEPGITLTPIEPDEFKRRALNAVAIVVTGEARLYGGAIIRMGVVAPDPS